MKKIILLGFLIIITLPIIFTYGFTKDHKEITLKRSIDINAPREKVFDFISHTENKANWLGNPDEKLIRSHEGTDGTVGFVRRWEVKNPPETGSETITKIQPNLAVETQINNNVNGLQVNSRNRLSCVPIKTGVTTVTWEMTTNLPMPFLARLLLGISEKLAQSTGSQQAYEEGVQNGLEKEGQYKDMDQSLQRLKNEIEKK